MLVYCDAECCKHNKDGMCENKWPIGTEAIKIAILTGSLYIFCRIGKPNLQKIYSRQKEKVERAARLVKNDLVNDRPKRLVFRLAAHAVRPDDIKHLQHPR